MIVNDLAVFVKNADYNILSEQAVQHLKIRLLILLERPSGPLKVRRFRPFGLWQTILAAKKSVH